MIEERKFVDMHSHSTHSDGTCSVEEILKLAEERNLAILSITDHNVVEAYEDIKDKKIRNIFSGILVPGCEVTTTYKGEVVEILGYKIEHEKFRELLAENLLSERDRRLRKYKVSCITVDTLTKLGVKFRENFGDDLYNNPQQFYDNRNESVMDGILREIKSFEENAKWFNSLEEMQNITTKDFVRNMVYNPKSKFYIDQRSIYPSLNKVIEIIHECGGLAFLAHLYIYSESVAENLDDIANNYGLDGLETYYTLFTEDQVEFLKKYTAEHDLYRSGGSDFHGERKPNHELGIGKGNMQIPKEIITEWL